MTHARGGRHFRLHAHIGVSRTPHDPSHQVAVEPAEREMLTRPALRLRSQPHPADTEREVEITAQRRPVSLNVGIASIATAVPAYKVSQQEVAERAMRLFPHLAQRGSLYSNTGIDTR